MSRYANWLHHLGMRYLGAFQELVTGKPVLFVPFDHPGAHEVRDLTTLVLLLRCEVNGLSKILCEKGITNPAELDREFEEQYKWFAEMKAKQFGCKVNDAGLVFEKK